MVDISLKICDGDDLHDTTCASRNHFLDIGLLYDDNLKDQDSVKRGVRRR